MIVRVVVGALLSVVGVVWILQGANVIHGSGMSGHSTFTVLGVALLVVGAAILAWAWRRSNAV